MAWRILGSNAIEPSDGDFDSAYRVKLALDDDRRDVVVEFEAPSAVPSIVYAEEVARKFLREDEPPARLVVPTVGSVRIVGQ